MGFPSKEWFRRNLIACYDEMTLSQLRGSRTAIDVTN